MEQIQNIIIKKDPPKPKTFEEKKNMFIKDHEKFTSKYANNSHLLELLDNQEATNSLSPEIEKYIKQIKDSFSDPDSLFYQLFGEKNIKNFFQSTIDVFKYIKKIYNGLDFSDEELKKCKIAEERFQKEFDINMYHIYFNLQNQNIKKLKTVQLKGVIDNFKYNKEYQPQILTLIINEPLLTNEFVIEELSELLQYCQKLQIVNLIIYPLDENGNLIESFGFDGLYYQMLYQLFYGISNNRNIKSLFIHSVKDYSLVFAPEISNLIIQKLQSETLVSFHIGNIILNGDFLKKFGFQILSTRSLLFLSIEMKEIKKSVIQHLMSNLPKNRSLYACSFVAPNIKGLKKKIQELKQELEKVKSQIQVMYIDKKTIIDYPPSEKKQVK
jgi:hypothetical protein